MESAESVGRLRVALRSVPGRFAWTSITLLAVYGLTAVQGAVVARILGPRARGELAVVVFFAYLLTNMGLLGGPLAVARRAAMNPAGAPTARSAAARLGLATGLGSAIIAGAMYAFSLPPEKSSLWALGILFSVTVPMEHVRSNLLGTDHGLSRFGHYNANRLLAVVAPLTLIGAAWGFGRRSVTDVVVAMIIASAISVGAWISTCPVPRFGGGAPPLLALVKESAPLGAAMVVSDLYIKLDLAMMLWWAPLTDQGYYASSIAAATALTIAPNAASLFVFNAGTRHRGDLPFWTLVSLALGFQVACAAAFWSVLGFLMPLVFGTGFSGAVPYARALVPAYALIGFSSVLEAYLRGSGRPLVGIVSRAFAALAMIGIAWVGFGAWGPLAVPIGASAAAAVNAMVTTVACWRVWRERSCEPQVAVAVT